MSNHNKPIKLADLIDIKLLQEFQDLFSTTMGFASLIVDDSGPVTKPSNFTEFCLRYTRGSKEGSRRCNECDIKWGKAAAAKGKPVVYNCHMGLTDFAVPIFVGSQYIASIYGGQVLTKKPDEKHFRQIARELGINEDEYINALNKIKILEPEKVDDAAKFLHLIASTISQIGYEKLQLIQQNTREQTLREIISIIGSSSNLEDIKKEIVKRIGIYFNADRVLWGDFDHQTETYNVTKKGEYRASEKLKSLHDFDFMSIPGFIENISNRHVQGEDIILTDLDEYTKEKGTSAEELCSFLKKQGFMAFMAININYGKLYFGNIVVAFANKKDISPEEIDFLKTIAKQAGFAVHQFNLYKEKENQIKREQLLSNILNKIKSSLEMDKILSFVCEESTKFFNVQRASIAIFPEQGNYYKYIIKKEYPTSSDIQLYPASEESSKTANYWGTKLIQQNEVIAVDNIETSDTPDYFKKMYGDLGIKAIMGVAIKKGNDVWGVLTLSDYISPREWSPDDKLLLQSIANKLYIAINQVEIYEKEKKNAEREKILSEIVYNSLSSFDVKQIKTIVNKIGMITNADRCFFIEVDFDNLKGKPTEFEEEYLASPDIKTIRGYEFLTEDVKEFIDLYVSSGDLVVFDYEQIRKENKKEDQSIIRYGNLFDVKTGIGVPIFCLNGLVGVLSIEYMKEKVFLPKEDLNFLRILGQQVSMAYNQITIYQNTVKIAKREALIHKIIQVVRSSLNLKVVKQKITEELGIAFHADRCYFRGYDKKQGKLFAPDVEYLSSKDVSSLMNEEPNQEELQFFIDEVTKKKRGFYPIVVDREFAKGTPLETYMEKNNIAADYAIPIIDRQDELLWLALHYSGQDPKLSEEDKKMLETIAYQIDIAFEQIKLYERVKKTAERELLLRNIIETIRSSIDIEKTKQVIIDALGKALQADRCFIMEYDKANDRFKEHSEEYLSSANQKSYIGDNLNDNIPNFVKEFKKGKTLLLNQSSAKFDGQTIDLEDGTFGSEKNAIEKYKVYSAVVLPIIYSGEFLGDIVLHYVDKEHEAGEDELELLQNVSGQLAIAFHHAQLFEQMKIQNEVQNAILNNIPFMAWLKDKNSALLAVNNAFVQNCNTKIEDCIGKTDFDFFPEQYALLYTNEDKMVMQTREKLSSNDLIVGTDGVARWHETFKSPVIDYKGNVVGTVGLAREITEMKDAIVEILDKQKEIAEAKEKESLLRNIFELIRSSLDLDETLTFISESIAKNFNVQRVAIVETPDKKDLSKFIVKKEYKSTQELKGITDVEGFAKIASTWTKNLISSVNVIALDDIEQAEIPENFKNVYREMGVKSIIGSPIRSADDAWGALVLSEYNKQRHWSDGEKELLKILSNQIYIAIKQAELFKKQKEAADKELTLRKTTEILRSTLDVSQIKRFFVELACSYFNADRCLFVSYNQQISRFLPFELEVLRGTDIKSLLNVSVEDDFPEFAYKLKNKKRNIIIKDLEKTLARQDLPNYKSVQSLYQSDAKSDYGFLVEYQNQNLGILILHYVKNKRKLTHQEIEFLKILKDQAGIALYQADLYEKQRVTAEKEKALKSIILSSISSFKFEEIISSIVTQTGIIFKADRCFYIGYDYSTDTHTSIKGYAQYLSSDSIRSHLTFQPSNESSETFIQQIKQKDVVTVDNIYEMSLPEQSRQMLIDELSVKSYMISPIFYGDIIYGAIVLHYVNNYKNFNEEDVDFAKSISYQSAIVIRQAELYEKEKLAAERERISRNIIEILRSSIDKIIIKKLFVKNIGKFFTADRVFISEYDADSKIFLPVDKDSEYLSNPSEKSFIGFDWSDTNAKDCVQPLLEKREVKIPDWKEFIDQNPDMPSNFLAMYENTQNKSSYAFPIMYQDKLMGFFCIEFTQKVNKLSEEDISRIRSICTQAGIALYHAGLYEKAQQSEFTREIFKAEIAKKIELPVNNILETSTLLSENEFERPVEINYLTTIIYSCNQLLELTKDISND